MATRVYQLIMNIMLILGKKQQKLSRAGKINRYGIFQFIYLGQFFSVFFAQLKQKTCLQGIILP
jgi:hypothetical protein